MSMHKIPLTELEHDGLLAHRLPIGVPSQLSDVFRSGIKWANEHRIAELQAKAVPDGWKLVPMKATDRRQQHDAAFNLCSEFGEEFTRSNRDFALRAYEWLVKFSPAAPAPAASPVVPEWPAHWVDQHVYPKDRLHKAVAVPFEVLLRAEFELTHSPGPEASRPIILILRDIIKDAESDLSGGAS